MITFDRQAGAFHNLVGEKNLEILAFLFLICFGVLRPQEHFLAEIIFSVNKNFHLCGLGDLECSGTIYNHWLYITTDYI